MPYPSDVWRQLKNISVEELIKALKRDSWVADKTNSGKIPYRKVMSNGEVRRVVIHYHPGKTYRSAKLLKGLFRDIGWSIEDLERLKLIRSPGKAKR